MGAHSSPESVLTAVETDAVRLRAIRLIDQFNDPDFPGKDCSETEYRHAWLTWEGQAYAVLCEVARG